MNADTTHHQDANGPPDAHAWGARKTQQPAKHRDATRRPDPRSATVDVKRIPGHRSDDPQRHTSASAAAPNGAGDARKAAANVGRRKLTDRPVRTDNLLQKLARLVG